MGWGIKPEQSQCGDVFPAEETACTKTQQDRARGPGEALRRVSGAGVEEPWGRQEGRAEPDRKFLDPGCSLGSTLMTACGRGGSQRVMTGTAFWTGYSGCREAQRLPERSRNLGQGSSKKCSSNRSKMRITAPSSDRLDMGGWHSLKVTTLGTWNHVSTGLQQPKLHAMPLGPAFLLDAQVQFLHMSLSRPTS